MSSSAAAPPAYPAIFSRAVQRVLANEGGYVDRADDPGGETSYGITRRDYPHLDVRRLTRDGAIAIYFRDFWSRGRYAELPEPLAEKLFDLSVNIGPAQAARCIQRALRACGMHLVEDGDLGNATLAAARAAGRDALMAALRSESAGHHRLTAALWSSRHGGSADEFLEGWLRRAYQ